MAAELLADAHADGRGDGLGQQRDVGRVIEPEEHGEHEHADEAGEHAGDHAGENCCLVALEQLQLLIERHGEADRRGGQEAADEPGALVVSGVVDVKPAEQEHHQHDGDQQRIHDRQTGLFLHLQAEKIGGQRHKHAEEHGGCGKFIHGGFPPRAFCG